MDCGKVGPGEFGTREHADLVARYSCRCSLLIPSTQRLLWLTAQRSCESPAVGVLASPAASFSETPAYRSGLAVSVFPCRPANDRA